jgi:hypothetical protein
MSQSSQFKTGNFESPIGSNRKHTGPHIHRNNFMNTTPITQQIRERLDNWECMKLKNLHSKGNSH